MDSGDFQVPLDQQDHQEQQAPLVILALLDDKAFLDLEAFQETLD